MAGRVRRAYAPGVRSSCLLGLALGACSSVGAIDAPRRPLAGTEPTTVRAKADEAVAKEDFSAAWNHELHAGADRGRLETIFLAALADDDGDAGEMFAQLRKAFGGLTPDGQAKVDAVASRAEAETPPRWKRSVEVHLLTAKDPPEFSAAWDVYRRAPPDDALDILEAIQDARKEHEEAAATRGP